MGLYPNDFEGRYTLQPGARGEAFQTDIPGYRDEKNDKRLNRTNFNLNVSLHDVPNIKWGLDERLPVLFRHGYAHGYNQIVVPKGRVMAVDPYLSVLDFETRKANNALTLANGGNDVKLGADNLWETVATARTAGKNAKEYYRTLGAATGTTVDENTGLCTNNDTSVRPANMPIGIMQRNEYTRDYATQNGMQPSPVLTDALVELPYFTDKAKAQLNPWGSAYGDLKPGDLVKSDENGRIVVSPLSRLDQFEDGALTFMDIERERQQVVGQVYEVSKDLVPAGAAKYAKWAMSDILRFENFNPTMEMQTGRRGEDLCYSSPIGKPSVQGGYNINTDKEMSGINPFDEPGHPWDKTMSQHDLHMLASTVRQSDLRTSLDHKLEFGIPGLTDGYNVFTKQIGPEQVMEIFKPEEADQFIPMSAKTSEQDIKVGSVKMAITTKNKKELQDSDFTAVAQGTEVEAYLDGTNSAKMTVKYLNELQGFLIVEVSDKDAMFDAMTKAAETLKSKDLNVYVKYEKKGLAGVPTMLDWDGCCGVVQVLFQK